MEIKFTANQLLTMACILECHHEHIMLEYQDCFNAKEHKDFEALMKKCDKTLENNGIKRNWKRSQRVIEEIQNIWGVKYA